VPAVPGPGQLTETAFLGKRPNFSAASPRGRLLFVYPLLLFSALFAQTPQKAKSQFEAATVKLSTSGQPTMDRMTPGSFGRET
jgi:hypothetical protein